MNVKELKELLSRYPDDMEVIYCLFSDYEMLAADDIGEVKAVFKEGYVMRSHRTMSQENKDSEKTYLCFPGN